MNKQIKKYLSCVKRRLNLPKEIRTRLLTDLQTTIDARLEQGESWDSVRESLGAPAQVAAEYTEQMKEFAYRKSPWRFAFLGAALILGVNMVHRLLSEFIPLRIFGQNGAENAAFISEIDGQRTYTMISTVEQNVLGSVSRVFVVCVICLLIYLRLRKCKQK